MMKSRIDESMARVFNDVRLRLREQNPQGVVYIFIPFFLVIILSLYSGFETSDRIKSHIEPFQYSSDKTRDHRLWMSLGLHDDSIVLVLPTGKLFRWPASGPSDDDYVALEAYMKNLAQTHLKTTILQGRFGPETNTAAIAVDQRLTVHHVRPLLYALAASGISKYGFETKLPRQEND